MLIKLLVNKKSIIQGIIIGLCMGVICFALSGSWKSSLFVCCVYVCASCLRIEVKQHCFTGIVAILSSFITILLVQNSIYEHTMLIELAHFTPTIWALNFLCVLCVVALLFSFTLHIGVAIAFSSILWMTLATVNHFVYEFRGNELCFRDLFSWATALNVANNYSIEIRNPVLYLWLVCIAIFFVLVFRTSYPDITRKMFARLCSLTLSFLCLITIATCGNHIPPRHWGDAGSSYNGFMLNFTISIRESFVQKPVGYESVDFAELEEKYADDSNPLTEDVNVIVIMDEAFSDLRIYSSAINTNEPFMPFYDSLSENTIKGSALSSVFGGNTANSEYEFLTGHTMAFLPAGSVPFQQYVADESYALPKYFQNLGYRTVAMHPFHANGWMRNTVWPQLGFDESYFLNSFPQEQMLRHYVSDWEMFEQIIRLVESNDPEQPLFLFGVTMQNHGDYTYSGSEFVEQIHLTNYNYPTVDEYLSLIKETDDALEYLISRLDMLEEKYVVLFFGDHQPNLDNAIYEAFYGKSFEALAEQQIQYTVPYLIWANYDIPEDEIGMTSINYLGSHLLEAAGIPIPAYQQFLLDLSESIPALNVLGYYSKRDGSFVEYNSALDEDKGLLNLYSALQYNCIFDTKNRSEIFDVKLNH